MISTRSVGLLIDTVVCLTLAKWETVSGRFGGYLTSTPVTPAQSGREEAHVRHETARVHHAARRRGIMAARGARAAGNAGDRAHGFGFSCGTELSDCRFCATVA